jgi:hypothetical protein
MFAFRFRKELRLFFVPCSECLRKCYMAHEFLWDVVIVKVDDSFDADLQFRVL